MKEAGQRGKFARSLSTCVSLYCIRTWEHVHSKGGQEQSISNPEKMGQYSSFILNTHLQKFAVLAHRAFNCVLAKYRMYVIDTYIATYRDKLSLNVLSLTTITSLVFVFCELFLSVKQRSNINFY